MKTLIPYPDPPPPDAAAHALYKEMEVDTMARTMWGEARGQGSLGLQAVACVILNRVRIARERGDMWWGNTIIQVCQKPYQFSCWNKSDPNYKKLLAVGVDNPYFATCLRLARYAVYARLDDPTHGADHYHAAGIMPFWAQHEKPVAVIGDHIFYRLT
jgi:spore germination cell wall hydrolase CwlJ-like protein